MARGVAVSLVTGRMVSSAMRFALELGLTGPVVGYQGALIRAMPEPGSGRLGKLLRPHAAAGGGRARRRPLDARPRARPAHEPPRAVHPPRRRPAGRRLLGVHGRARRARPEPARGGPAPGDQGPRGRRAAVARPRSRRSRRRPSPVGRTSRSATRASSSSSRRASRRVAPSAGWPVACGVPLGATLAVGDQWNDLEMLAEVGHGAAMPTAPAEVRAVARYVAPPLEDEGVAPAHRRPRPGRSGRRARPRPDASRTKRRRSAGCVVTART